MKALIVGAGSSTADLLPYKNNLNYDYIVGVGGTFQHWDDILDCHIVTEKYLTQQDELNQGSYRTDLLRLVNYKSKHRYNPKYHIVGITRSQMPDNFNTRELIPTEADKPIGLLVGPINADGLSTGSVVLSAIHWCSHKGATEITLVGVDLCFKGEYDHYYPDRFYRDQISKHANAAKPIVVDGISTTDYFYESASVLDNMMRDVFKDIRFYDMSNGLLKYPTRLIIGVEPHHPLLTQHPISS